MRKKWTDKFHLVLLLSVGQKRPCSVLPFAENGKKILKEQIFELQDVFLR